MKDRELLVGLSGGIAAYKTAELVSLCVQAGARVSVVMTESARQFVGRTTFEALTGRPVYCEQFQPREHHSGEHIALARRAELICIAPATANIIAKFAHGIADDLLTTLVLAAACPIIVAPAMNAQMWQKPAVQRNVAQLRADGFQIIGPEEGWLSCGERGPGRMAEPERIFEQIAALLQRR